MKSAALSDPKSEVSDDDSEWSDVGELVCPDLPAMIRFRVYAFHSIEYVKLKIHDKAKGPRQIYGDIMIETRKKNCIYIYHRHGYEAQPVPAEDDDVDGFHLTLCGPRHCVSPNVDFIKVDLYKEGGEPFLSGELVVNNGDVRVPIYEHLDLPNDLGRLTLCYTRLYPSYPANFQFMVIRNKEGEGEGGEGQMAMAVQGTIKAKHILEPITEPAPNLLTMFQATDKPVTVTVTYGEPLPLLRSHFIMPVMPDNLETLHGFEDFLTVWVDLQVVLQDDCTYFIRGEAKIVLYHSDRKETPKYFMVEDSLKRKLPSQGSLDRLKIKISVTPFLEDWPVGDELVQLIH